MCIINGMSTEYFTVYTTYIFLKNIKTVNHDVI